MKQKAKKWKKKSLPNANNTSSGLKKLPNTSTRMLYFLNIFFRRILSDFLTHSGLSIFDFRKYMFKLILEYGELKWNKIYMQSFSKIRDFMVKNLALNDRTPKRVSYFGKWL